MVVVFLDLYEKGSPFLLALRLSKDIAQQWKKDPSLSVLFFHCREGRRVPERLSHRLISSLRL